MQKNLEPHDGHTLSVPQLERLYTMEGNPQSAAWHKAYMRHQFDFAGIQQPLRKKLQASFIAHWKKLSLPDVRQIIAQLWASRWRECQYTGVDLTCRYHWPADSIHFFETLIMQKGWWDTVDVLAPNVLGKHLLLFPENLFAVHCWREHHSCWLRRASILYQLRYRSATNWEELENGCLLLRNDPHEFVRNAVRWAVQEAMKSGKDFSYLLPGKQDKAFSKLKRHMV